MIELTEPCHYCGEPLPLRTVPFTLGEIHGTVTTIVYDDHAEHCTTLNVCGAPVDPDPTRSYLPPRLNTACRRRPQYRDGRCRLHVGT